MTGKLIVALRKKLPSCHVRVSPFQSLLDAKIKKYESGSFEVGGWRLNLDGNESKVANNIALTQSFPRGRWFLKNLSCYTNGVGFRPVDVCYDLQHTGNCYLVKDSSSSVMEVSVVENTGKGEDVSIIHTPNTIYSVEVPNILSLEGDKPYKSVDFCHGDLKWNVSLHPKGSQADGFKNMSLFLNLVPSKYIVSELPTDHKVFVAYKLRIVDRSGGRSLQKEGTFWFSEAHTTAGFSNFAPIDVEFKEGSGYFANNTLTVEVEFKQMIQFEYYLNKSET